MLKKLFVTAAAAAAVSVPLAGAAWAAPGDDPNPNAADGAPGKGGLADKASAWIKDAFTPNNPPVDFSQFESGNSGNIAPGTAFSQGAKVPDANAVDGYEQFLTNFYNTYGLPFSGGPVQGVTVTGATAIPGSVTRLFTPGCGKGNGPSPSVSVNGTPVPAPCV